MSKRKTQTIEAILLGDILGQMVDRLSAGEASPDKIIVIGVGHNGVGVVLPPSMSLSEAVGALYLAIDKLHSLIYEG